MNFSPSSYFDLDKFAHRDIFTQVKQAWEALPKLESFILNWLHHIPKTKRLLGKIHPQAIIEGDVFIGQGTTVEPFAYIKGPTIIGSNCDIRHAAFIRGNVIADDQSVIGHTTEVKNSILMRRVWAAHFAYIGDSIIGNTTELGAGVKLANMRLDEAEVVPGLSKLGSIIGDGTSIGCNTVLNPGTILGKNCAVYPATSVVGHYPDSSRIK